MAYDILIVDDSATVRGMIAKTLNLSGLPLNALHAAKNGQEALALMQGHWMDLVLTDLNMPEMDGMEMVRRMSEDEALRTVPVVVVSTEGSEERITALKRHGIRGYLRKPFTPEQVREAVEGVLGGRNE